ncbi:short-chain dehydrogenase [Sporosarcina sp. NCCP-2716]|uniref:short-chain dehydrogenase n=1 Tax=Sporosarcina sp. NCCP-2716 TaxID=2943679 RepID=UPI00203FBC64|nr:short-chain dehydrogenase [Sporosarcina sp. NCCP-2716]GKV68650.1 short-chain dehydrogenase [Sporosarcina sp. NCCP-2716]
MKHALVVGGTGMLSGVSQWLVSAGYHVSIIARSAERMNELVKRVSNSERVTPLLVDYKDDLLLRMKIKEAIHQNGPIGTVVAWIHSDAVSALPLLLQEVSMDYDNWELYHVLGSQANAEEVKRSLIVPANCLYSQVQLGFVLDNGHPRWLTNQEISDGVLDAIRQRTERMTVGQVEPHTDWQ